jgi:hypothetical protein
MKCNIGISLMNCHTFQIARFVIRMDASAGKGMWNLSDEEPLLTDSCYKKMKPVSNAQRKGNR